MKERTKRLILWTAAGVSVLVLGILGYYYWEGLFVGALAVWMGLKKLLSLKSLWGLLKKLPWILLLGLKRLIIKIMGQFLWFSAHVRFRHLQRWGRLLRIRAWRVKKRLLYHWNELYGWERVLAVVAALPLSLALSLWLLVFGLPRAAWRFLGSKIKEHSGALILQKSAPRSFKARWHQTERELKDKIRQHLGNEHTKPRDDAQSE